MVDREARDKLIAATESFLAGEIRSDDFHDRIWQIDSHDRTVAISRDHLDCCVNDMENHEVNLDRRSWNFVQRLLLVLHSDSALIDDSGARTWRWPNIAALIVLAVYVANAVALGWTPALIFLHIPTTICSMIIARWLPHDADDAVDDSIYPFESFAQLRTVRRDVRGFRKCRYPVPNAPPSSLLRWLNAAYTFLGGVFVWTIAAPVALTMQAIPERCTAYVVHTGSRIAYAGS